MVHAWCTHHILRESCVVDTAFALRIHCLSFALPLHSRRMHCLCLVVHAWCPRLPHLPALHRTTSKITARLKRQPAGRVESLPCPPPSLFCPLLAAGLTAAHSSLPNAPARCADCVGVFCGPRGGSEAVGKDAGPIKTVHNDFTEECKQRQRDDQPCLIRVHIISLVA